jgi:NAD(P)-dependent dehydrogenase (short-subunit alcohol dehydrogenase family)
MLRLTVFPSEMSEPIVKLYTDSTGEVGSMDFIPLGRMGDEQEMAGSLLYLASRAGGYCNGAVILVDGGRLGSFPSTN